MKKTLKNIIKPEAGLNDGLKISPAFWITAVAIGLTVACTAVFAKDSEIEACKSITLVTTKGGVIISDSVEDFALSQMHLSEQKARAYDRIRGVTYSVVNTNGKCTVTTPAK